MRKFIESNTEITINNIKDILERTESNMSFMTDRMSKMHTILETELETILMFSGKYEGTFKTRTTEHLNTSLSRLESQVMKLDVLVNMVKESSNMFDELVESVID